MKKHAVTGQELTELLDTLESIQYEGDLNNTFINGAELVKVHGGATAVESGYTTKDRRSLYARDLNREVKQKIGKYAATLVQAVILYIWMPEVGVDIMIDYLTQADAVYVTNSIGHAQKLLQKRLSCHSDR